MNKELREGLHFLFGLAVLILVIFLGVFVWPILHAHDPQWAWIVIGGAVVLVWMIAGIVFGDDLLLVVLVWVVPWVVLVAAPAAVLSFCLLSL